MKILQIHNEYLIKGGEDTIVNNEKELLQKKGHKVKLIIRKNKNEIKSILDWFSILKNLSSSKKSVTILENYFKKNEIPDIVHIHNLFPLWSFSILKFFKEKKIPIIITVHNYRLLLDKIKFFDNNYYKYGLFKNSKIITYIIAILFNKNKEFLKYVSNFIYYTNFQKNIYENLGFDKKKSIVKKNSLQMKRRYIKWNYRDDKITYVGRLSPEKGLHTLLKAWKIWGKDAPILEIIGNGNEDIKLQYYKKKNLLANVIFCGKLTYEKVQKKIEKTKLLIIPSEWYEPFGLGIFEALSKGTPVATSDSGSLPSLVKYYKLGFSFKSKNENSLLKKVKSAWLDKNYLETLSKQAKNTNKFYTPLNNYKKLMSIYKKAININKKDYFK